MRQRSSVIDAAVRTGAVRRTVHAFRRRKALSQPVRFAALELFGRDNRGALHRLRDSPVRVAVRHRSPDIIVLDEVLAGSLAYEPPEEMAHMLTDGMSVLDLGANVGLFGAFVLQRFPDASIVSVEPDPFNVPVIKRCIEANRGSWQLIRASASVRSEQLLFEAGRYCHSRLAEVPSAQAISVPAIDAFPLINSADFVKIDIEGGEWPLLRDPRFQRVTPSVIVLEWHETGCWAEDAYGAAIEALTGAGYSTIGTRSAYSHGLIWGWRERVKARS
ncbi:MAG: FkbM family methyltransferase [Actinobacteria bacterium]|nr:FkbM family methyltransferase [Actinomycetota bacterium]